MDRLLVTPLAPRDSSAADSRASPILQPWLITRAALLLIVGLGLRVTPFHGWEWQAFRDYPFLDGWVRWDSGWYRTVFEHGYSFTPGAQCNVVFWPGYPILAGGLSRAFRWATDLEHAFYLAALLLSHAAFLIALVGFERWVRRRAGEESARRAVWLLCCFPFSFYSAAAYPEALFLAFAVWAFCLADEQRWWGAISLAGLAALTRLPGAFVIAGVLVDRWAAERWRWRRLPAIAPLALAGALPVLVMPIYFHHRFGDALVFMRVQRDGWTRTLGVGHLWLAVRWLAERHTIVETLRHCAFLALIPIAVVMTVRARRSSSAGALVFAALSVALVVSSGYGYGSGLEAVGRHLFVVFPLFAAAAALRGRRHAVVCGALLILQVVFACSFSHWGPIT